MKKRLCRKFFVLALSVLMILTLVPTTAFAAEEGTIDVTVAITNAGKVEVANETVTVKDMDADGALTINDALIAAHEKFAPNGAADYGTSTTEWGLGITKLWGSDAGSFGYYLNDGMANSLSDPIQEGDYVYAWVYTDQTNWSDMYSYFDKKSAEATAAEPLTLTYCSASWDDNWNPVFGPCAGAEVGYYEGDAFKSLGTTDVDGKVTLTFAEAGDYVVTATAPEGSILAAPVCNVKVAPAPLEGTVDVTVAITDAGEVEVANETVTVGDLDADGAFTINDALIAAHEKFAPNGAADYATSATQWGLGITKLWGSEAGSFGYYLNDGMAYNLTDPIKEGDYVYAWVYTDQANWSDMYSYFDKKSAETTTAEPLTLTYCSASWDDNWNPVFGPCAGAEVGYYEGDTFKSLGTTDADGKVALTFAEAGDFVVTATAPEGSILAAPVCNVKVVQEQTPTLEAPVITSSKNLNAGTMLTWTAVEGAEYYVVSFNDGVVADHVTGTTYTVPKSMLESGRKYSYQVVAVAGETQSEPSPQKVQTYLAAPTVTKTKNLNAGTQVTWAHNPIISYFHNPIIS